MLSESEIKCFENDPYPWESMFDERFNNDFKSIFNSDNSENNSSENEEA